MSKDALRIAAISIGMAAAFNGIAPMAVAGGLGEVMISRSVPYCDTDPNDRRALRQIRRLPDYAATFEMLRTNCPDIALALTDLPTASILSPSTRGRDFSNVTRDRERPVPVVTDPDITDPGTDGPDPVVEVPGEEPVVTTPDDPDSKVQPDGSPVPHGKTRAQYERYLAENGGRDPVLERQAAERAAQEAADRAAAEAAAAEAAAGAPAAPAAEVETPDAPDAEAEADAGADAEADADADTDSGASDATDPADRDGTSGN